MGEYSAAGRFAFWEVRCRGGELRSMGPVVGDEFSQESFLHALDALAQQDRLAMIEIETPALSEQTFRSFGYHAVSRLNMTVQLDSAMWKRLDPRARTKVRKARSHGLTVSLTDNPAIADEFYNQCSARLLEKKLVVSFGRKCPHLLYKYLAPQDLLFVLHVRDRDGNVAATALCPHDERMMYGWGRSSARHSWGFAPNEFLQWCAMELGVQRGLSLYDVCNYGEFFSKFGGQLHECNRWHKCYLRSASLARWGYERYIRAGLKVRGGWHALASNFRSR